MTHVISSPQTHLLDHFDAQLDKWLAANKYPAYRRNQIKKWVFQHRSCAFDEMSDLSKDLRAELALHFQLWSMQIAEHRQADDGTEKLLLDLKDGERIEAVLIRERQRRTICISTQVGCAMGCVFCASGLDGVVRNLTCGEIVEQMLLLSRLLPPDERLSHIVVMGMGEPLANLDHVLEALGMATDQDGLGISPRRVTISTVGLPPAMERLAECNIPYHLAVSLHAPNDLLRNRIVPVNDKIGIGPILQAAERFFERTGRRLTFEYVLLGDLNDRPEHARELAALLRGNKALVNVIPYNPVAGLDYQSPSKTSIRRFLEILESAGIQVHVRQRKGDAIDAACGQLRRIRGQVNTTQ